MQRVIIGDTDHIVGLLRFAHGGRIFIFPGINPALTKDSNTSKKLSESLYTFVKLVPYLPPKKIDTYEIFDWIENMTYLDIQNLEIMKNNLSSELNLIKAKISALETESYAKNDLLNSIMQTGEALEKSVKTIFKLLGYNIPDSNATNRVDLILTRGSRSYVLEVKGVKSTSGEKNAAQLEKWVSEYIIEFGTKPKGILLVNTHRKTNFLKRPDIDFPHQMQKYSENRNHCLLTVASLLDIYADFNANLISEVEIDDLLFNTKGVLSYSCNSDQGVRQKI